MKKMYVLLMTGCLILMTSCHQLVKKEQMEWNGRMLSGLLISKQGMAYAPYYTIVVKDSNIIAKMSNMMPLDAYRNGLIEKQDEEGWEYLYQAHTITDYEEASLISISQKQYTELMKTIKECGALNWDGFHQSVMDTSLDSGTIYYFYLRCNDETKVKVYGSNTCPEGFDFLYEYIVNLCLESIGD